jgi:hypothetical protein
MRPVILLTAMLSMVPAGLSRGDDVRYYEKDGVTYCETRRVVQQRVPVTQMQQQPQTYYREQYTTEVRDTVRTCWTPVTQYQTEAVMVGRWNPFVTPYVEYHTVPTVRWEQKSQVVKTPVTCRKLVPETKMVSSPVTAWQTVEQEVINRFAVTGKPSGAAVAASRAPAPTTAAVSSSSPPSILSPPARLTPSVAASRPSMIAPPTPVDTPEVARRDQVGGISRLDAAGPRPGGTTVPSLLSPIRR